MRTPYLSKKIHKLNFKEAVFRDRVCYTRPCPGCGGTIFLFLLPKSTWWYCNKCRNVGTVQDLEGKKSKKGSTRRKVWNYFKALRVIFDQRDIPSHLLQAVGLSAFETDPVRMLMSNKLYGYVDCYKDFYNKIKQDMSMTHITPDFTLYKNSATRNKAGFVLPLENLPGMVGGFSFISDTFKFSMQDKNSKRYKEDLYTFLQVGNNGREYVFNDIIDDFADICFKMMTDRDCTILVRPCTEYSRDVQPNLPRKNKP